ncbi:MAG TPA: Crp/Fnr family transcriptional regulator [Sphaerochaeta sp.]|nr:Crp/Fnr family transcriptional regulator [Sphaerochaeta sp.]
MEACTTCADGPFLCLTRVPIFQNLDTGQIARVQRLIRQRTLTSGEVLFRQGDSSDRLIIIRTGTLKLVRYGSDGQQFLLETLFAGDFYGGDQLFSESHYRETGVAGTPLGICTIASSDIRSLMLSDPHIGLSVMTYLNGKLEQYRLKVEMLATRSVEKRLAMFLLERVSRTSSDAILLSQEEIGAAINLTKETVNRKLSQMQDNGLVSVVGKKRILLLDRLALEKLATE